MENQNCFGRWKFFNRETIVNLKIGCNIKILESLKEKIKNQINQGTSPDKVAQSLALGVIAGSVPYIGLSTLVAFVFGYCFKLNHIILQTANYLMSPIQLMLIPLYIKLVSLVFPVGDVPIRPDIIISLFIKEPIATFKLYWLISLYASVIWILFSLVFYFLIKASIKIWIQKRVS